jgi:hypothetical protein
MTFLATLRRAISEIALGFCILNRIQFEAPWRSAPQRRC